jgi:hypothetical protein
MNWLLSSCSAQGQAVGWSPWLQDEFVECYGRWREESTGVRLYRECAHRIAGRG